MVEIGTLVHTRSVLHQKLHHLRLRLSCRPHQRRLPAPLLAAFTSAPALISNFAASTLLERATTISAVCPSAFADFHICAGLEKHLDDRRIADHRRFAEWSGVVVVACLDVCARRDETLYKGRVIVVDRPVESRRAVEAHAGSRRLEIET